ncbi:MAG TPA: cold shock domain-containing protein [Candidatus Polarisedimenticolia bacterium]|nr:cold shock domain-containing protein [Candidatus Polarisedimenticolia bacterium]
METGTIKFFSDRGYGFIRPSSGDADVFFHITELPEEYRQQTIQEGTCVQYELGVRNGKKTARNMVILAGVE